ncbi:MAG TPA: tRNA guanosine(34) transglycosylase Tgt [Alphaproteobacteria bacterium]|nr:tRNA guanosine(34) transglycosylase Tgt [Alphaproteobacteria bacterium]
MNGVAFTLLSRDGKARRGRLTTAHGAVETPAFMPVGTAATVKAMTPGDVRATGAEIILANTYHLMLRPGAERIARLGGLHRFMNWPGPLLTDSGGYQVMSLAELRKIDERGVTFQSHIDGARHTLTPERSIEIQQLLGADITMAFDECTPYPASEDDTARSMRLSMRWAERSLAAFQPRPGYGVFGIVQGGMFRALREESAAMLTALAFDGYAIGGLAVGEDAATRDAMLEASEAQLPVDRPRYLMGVGKPADIVAAAARGVDMFDCVLPTRSGRTAQAFTRRGALNLRNARHADDDRPLDADCRCPACTGYSRAYLHHLSKAGEILGAMLLTRHNLTYYQDLMTEIRAAIDDRAFGAYVVEFARLQAAGDVPARGPAR